MNQHTGLHRNPDQKVIAGVCSGIAEYLTLDPVIVRLIFVLLAVIAGGGFLVYLILWIVLPKKPFVFPNTSADYSKQAPPEPTSDSETSQSYQEVTAEPVRNKSTQLITGVVLIVVGLVLLLPSFFESINFADLWPIALIVVGLILLKPTLK